jgi:hypothetical protein
LVRSCDALVWTGSAPYVARYLRRIDPETLIHLDRVVLPVLKRLAQALPVTTGSDLLAPWDVVMAGRWLKQLQHLVERWHDLVRSQPPTIPAG